MATTIGRVFTTQGSRVKITGCGTAAINGVYTSITCDGVTPPTSTTYQRYVYWNADRTYKLELYQYNSSTYYWQISNTGGTRYYYRSPSTSTGQTLANIKFPWEDGSISWNSNSGTAPAPNYMAIEFCGNPQSWGNGGVIYGDKFVVTTSDNVQHTLVYDDSYTTVSPEPTASCKWVNADGWQCVWEYFSDTQQGQWTITNNGTVVCTTEPVAEQVPTKFPWEYLAPFITNNCTLSTAGSRVVIEGTGTTAVNTSYYSMTIDKDTAIDANTKWTSLTGNSIVPYYYTTNDYRWRITQSSGSYYYQQTSSAGTSYANMAFPWTADAQWSIYNGSTPAPTRSSFKYMNQAYRPEGFTNKIQVIGADDDINGTYDLVGFYWSDETKATTSSTGELHFFTAEYAKSDSSGYNYRVKATDARGDGTNSTEWIITDGATVFYRAPIAASATGKIYYPQDNSLAWEDGDDPMYTMSSTLIILAGENSDKIPTSLNLDITVANAGTAEANGTYTPVSARYGSLREWSNGTYYLRCKYQNSYASGPIWVIEDTPDNVYYYAGGTGLVTDTSSGLLVVPEPYNEDGTTLTWTVDVGATPEPSVTADVPQGVFVVAGITGTHAAANGNYLLVSGTGLTAKYKHASANYWIYTGYTGTWWTLDNTENNMAIPPSHLAYYGTASVTNPYPDTGSYTWNNGNGGTTGMTTTKL